MTKFKTRVILEVDERRYGELVRHIHSVGAKIIEHGPVTDLIGASAQDVVLALFRDRRYVYEGDIRTALVTSGRKNTKPIIQKMVAGGLIRGNGKKGRFQIGGVK